MVTKKPARRSKKKRPARRSRSTRKTKDGLYYAVNVYIHTELLDRLDTEAEAEDRTRRAQLERVLCRAFGVEHTSLNRNGGLK